MTHKTFQARLHGPKTKTYKIDRHDREENSKREGVLNKERPRTGQLAVPWLLRASAGRTRWPNPETRCSPRSRASLQAFFTHLHFKVVEIKKKDCRPCALVVPTLPIVRVGGAVGLHLINYLCRCFELRCPGLPRVKG